MKQRDNFSTKFGFILSCVGSAVGVGNLWLFPWRVGSLGGAAFLIPYFIFVILLGMTGLVGEFGFGRWAKTGPIGAFEKALTHSGKNGKIGAILGVIPVLGALGIAVGYSVVVGWIIRFLAGSITGSMIRAENSGAYFGEMAVMFGSTIWHVIAIVIIVIIMCGGVSKGIERVNKVMMPAFYILLIIVLIRVLTLENSIDGVKYLVIPRWDALSNPKTWVYALGQAFFSLSLAGHGMLVYGSYLKDNVNVPSAAIKTAIFDTLAALLAAFTIIPAVFAFGLDPAAGPPLLFITLPEVFKQMPFGQLFAIIFFISVLFAAITSILNLLEPPIEALQSRLHLSRKKSVVIVCVVALFASIPLEDGNLVGTWMDMVSIYFIPFGAMLAAIFFYWVFGYNNAKAKIEIGMEGKKLPAYFEFFSKYLFVFIIFIVIILGFIYGGIG